MPVDMAYIGRNLNARTSKSLENFRSEAMGIMAQATLAGALNGSRTFIQFWQAGIEVLEREMQSAIQFVYNATGEHTGQVYEQLAYCSNQMVERIVQDVKERAGREEKAFGAGYSDIVDRMHTAMKEKRERLLDDFQHGMIGSERMKKDPVVSIIANQTNSPGAIQQVGAGTFSQSAMIENRQALLKAIETAKSTPEFKALQPSQQDGFTDIADAITDETAKDKPDPGKLRRWGERLMTFGQDVGMQVTTAAIVDILTKMFTS